MESMIFHSKRLAGGYLKYYSFISCKAGRLPLLIYIHGSGSRGDDLSQVSRIGPLSMCDEGRLPDCILIAPQCHSDSWFDVFDTLLELIDLYRLDGRVDASRVYLVGVSMGAYAAWQLCLSQNDWFAAAVPICGGGMYWNAVRLKDIPIWAFHGILDDVVSPDESVKMVSSINRCGGAAKLTLLPHAEHDAWTEAFENNALWQWLFAQKKG